MDRFTQCNFIPLRAKRVGEFIEINKLNFSNGGDPNNGNI